MFHSTNIALLAAVAGLSLTACMTTSRTAAGPEYKTENVIGFPTDEDGYGLGVSACYAGRIGDCIIMAGGCNFPEPGKKRYYKGIYAARPDGNRLNWRLVGYLPEAAAYGVTVESGDSLVLAGGCNTNHSLSSALSLHLDTTRWKATLRQLPSLPCTADNTGGTRCGNNIYVVGGLQDGKPSTDTWTAHLSGTLHWTKIPSLPGTPRVQPACASDGTGVYVWGGFSQDGENSTVHCDGWRYDTSSGKWHPLSAPQSADGQDLTLSGGTATTIKSENGEKSVIVCTGGVNKDIFLDAISGRYQLTEKTEYLNHLIDWYRFNGLLLTYDTSTKKWLTPLAHDKRLARAGAQAVVIDDKIYYIGGELKPAVRTPDIVRTTRR